MKKNCLYITLLFILSSCQYKPEHIEHEAEMVADSFAIAYFNYDFKDAVKFVTDDSRKWVHYAASNVNEKDIALLRSAENDAVVSIDSAVVDNEATVYITVYNALHPDTIGAVSGKFADKASYRIRVVHQGGWKVKMEGPLRSER